MVSGAGDRDTGSNGRGNNPGGGSSRSGRLWAREQAGLCGRICGEKQQGGKEVTVHPGKPGSHLQGGRDGIRMVLATPYDSPNIY